MKCMENLKELSIRSAVSAAEYSMSDYIKSLFEDFCDSAEIDKFYNVIGTKRGLTGKKKIMITAHYDEIGLIVTGITDEGFIRFSNIGGIDSKILLAQEVIIHGKEDIFGIIGAKPPHLLKPEESKNAVKRDDLVIDVGMKGDKVRESISIGDVITFKTVPLELNGNKLSSKCLDNRCGVATALELAKELQVFKIDSDIIFVATTQEEVGLRGAKVASYSITPDIAIVIDACHGDMTDAPKGETYTLGKGPAIGIGPNLHKKLTKKIIEIAKNENISYQLDLEPGDTGTEAWTTQVSRLGIPTVLISIPLRYMHTCIETIHINDVKSAARLTARFISKIEQEMEEILCY